MSNDGQESGIFFEPTLLSKCDHDMFVVQNKIHAPILCALTASFETAAEQLNDSEYGTGVRIFTRQVDKYN
jgi:acyl-CoA reductase-like NAD-dependent aldehyde dehydrogenase